MSWTEAAELTTMDPSKATDRYDTDQFNNVMEGLIRLGNNAKTTPGIAKSWKENSDGKYKLTVTLDRRIPYFKLLMGFYIFSKPT